MLHCLRRVMERIVATIRLACPQSVPNADDFLPVLIFTVLQVSFTIVSPDVSVFDAIPCE